MDKNLIRKWLLLFVLTAGSVWLVSRGLHYGLDIKGGMSFTVGIDTNRLSVQILGKEPNLNPVELQARVGEVMEKAQDRVLEVLRSRIDSLGISEPAIFPSSGNRITIQLPGIDKERREEAKKLIFSVAFLEFRMVHEDNYELTEKLFKEGAAPKGYLIGANGHSYVRDPAVKDDLVESQAWRDERSSFHLIDAGANYEFMLDGKQTDGGWIYTPVFVSRYPELTGDYLKNAQVNQSQIGLPTVGIEFSSEGAKLFGAITEAYAPGGSKNPDPEKRRQMAIILDGKLYSAPTINEAIYGGNAEISGNFKTSEAQLLVNILQSGALPAPLVPMGEVFVDPSLGKDAIASGIKAGVIGAVSVLVFMWFYYRINGFIADAALLMNVVLMPIGMVIAAGFLAVFAKMAGQGGMGSGGGGFDLPVLTLQGIAGIFLTIGMAVDANVLILERIREELRAGKTLFTAIRAGYDRAFITIVDSHITTLLTGLILFIYGSGPIRGYAVTLCGGLLISLYTAITVTRMVYETLAAKGKTISLHMLHFVGKTSIDFIAKQGFAISLSVIVTVVTWLNMGYKANQSMNSVFGVDFTGGAAVTFSFDKKADVSDIRNALDEEGFVDTHIQYQQDTEDKTKEHLEIRVGSHPDPTRTPGEVMEDALNKHLKSAGFKAMHAEDVGPQVGKELAGKAILAVVFSLLGIILYLTIRFEFGFALGALVSLIHDVLIAVGVFVLFKKQLNMTSIAAVLTVVGYSVNDTIVVFDRIREDLRIVRNKTLREISNQAINETLSRTILTTLATMMVVTALLIWGRGEVRDFAMFLFIGMSAGIYSTTFIATPVVLKWYGNTIPALANKKSS